MVNIKRLHNVHKNYPNNYRREGKTTYCFDSLLRCSQTGFYKNLCYVTSTERATQETFKDFIVFLDENNELYDLKFEKKVIYLYGVRINFSTESREERGMLCKYGGYVIDSFKEDIPTPQYKLDSIEDWSKRQLTRSVYRKL